MISISPDKQSSYRNPISGIKLPTVNGVNLGLPEKDLLDLADLRTLGLQIDSLHNGQPFWFLNGAGSYFTYAGQLTPRLIGMRDFDPAIDPTAEQYVMFSNDPERGHDIVLGTTRLVRGITSHPNLFTHSFLYENDGQPDIFDYKRHEKIRSVVEEDEKNGLKTVAWERHCTFSALLAYAATNNGAVPTEVVYPLANGSYDAVSKAINLALFYAVAEEIAEDESVFIITNRGLNFFLSRLLPSHINLGKFRTYGIKVNEQGEAELESDQISICRVLGKDILESRERIRSCLLDPLIKTSERLNTSEQAIHDSVLTVSHFFTPFPDVVLSDFVLAHIMNQTTERLIKANDLQSQIAKKIQDLAK